eukprot:6026626-Prymnesium_polylepis.1
MVRPPPLRATAFLRPSRPRAGSRSSPATASRSCARSLAARRRPTRQPPSRPPKGTPSSEGGWPRASR